MIFLLCYIKTNKISWNFMRFYKMCTIPILRVFEDLLFHRSLADIVTLSTVYFSFCFVLILYILWWQNTATNATYERKCLTGLTALED